MARANPKTETETETETDTDESPLNDLTGFQRDLLRTVEKLDDPIGLDIKESIEVAYGDNAEIHHGRLYPNLNELVEKGLIKKWEKDRRTNGYDITSRGVRELDSHRDWLSQ